jgi:hypothetical protein
VGLANVGVSLEVVESLEEHHSNLQKYPERDESQKRRGERTNKTRGKKEKLTGNCLR